jgi:transcriptional regulator with GAF, ATPase, and Fis domain
MMIAAHAADDERSVKFARTLVELADTLVHDFDVVAFLQMLSDRCVDLFSVTSAGVMLHDQRDSLQVIASSDERGRTLELMELQNQEGPCLDAFRLAAPVQASADAASERWPVFASHARLAGYHTFAALPLRLRGTTIGALNLFSNQTSVLAEDEIIDAQALADIATIGLLNERAVRESRLLAEQLQHALTSRVVLEQAKGVLAVKLNCHVDEAFLVMRSYARSHNLRLGDIARQVIDGEVTPPDLKG